MAPFNEQILYGIVLVLFPPFIIAVIYCCFFLGKLINQQRIEDNKYNRDRRRERLNNWRKEQEQYYNNKPLSEKHKQRIRESIQERKQDG